MLDAFSALTALVCVLTRYICVKKGCWDFVPCCVFCLSSRMNRCLLIFPYVDALLLVWLNFAKDFATNHIAVGFIGIPTQSFELDCKFSKVFRKFSNFSSVYKICRAVDPLATSHVFGLCEYKEES